MRNSSDTSASGAVTTNLEAELCSKGTFLVEQLINLDDGLCKTDLKNFRSVPLIDALIVVRTRKATETVRVYDGLEQNGWLAKLDETLDTLKYSSISTDKISQAKRSAIKTMLVGLKLPKPRPPPINDPPRIGGGKTASPDEIWVDVAQLAEAGAIEQLVAAREAEIANAQKGYALATPQVADTDVDPQLMRYLNTVPPQKLDALADLMLIGE